MQAYATTIAVPRTVKPGTILITLLVVSVVVVGAIALTQSERAGSAPVALGPADGGSSIALEVGGELTISLPANPSTGYGWVVTSINPALLAQTGDPEFSAESDLVGAGGTMTFHFEGTAAGQDSLQLDYLRPWENVEPLETYTGHYQRPLTESQQVRFRSARPAGPPSRTSRELDRVDRRCGWPSRWSAAVAVPWE